MADTDTNTEGTEPEGTDGEGAQAPETDWKAEADKWKALSRKHEGQAKSNATAAEKLKEMEDANKSEIDKVTSKATEASKRADAAEAKATRYEVAHEKQVPTKLMKFLTGQTREEIEASADELLEATKPDTGANSSGKPREKLRSGASDVEDTGDDKSIADVLAAIPRG